jgi:hypothetical protein
MIRKEISFVASRGAGWPTTVAAALFAVVFAGYGTAAVCAQEAPTSEQVLDAYVEAIGGLTALEKIQNRVTKAAMQVPAVGIQLSVTTYQARPNLAYSVVDSAATGKIETGTDGSVAWQISATAGAQVLEGKEKATQLHLNMFDRLVYWRKAFKEVENKGLEDVAGRPCYKIVATTAELSPQTLYFDRESRLLVKLAMTIEGQAGNIPVETTISDYKAVDGIMLPHKTVVKTIGPERIITVEKIDQNVVLPADRFALPAELRTLVEKLP